MSVRGSEGSASDEPAALKAKHPGLRSQPNPARRPGRLLLVHDPPLVDLLALASRSTQCHRPSAQALAGDPFVSSSFPGEPVRISLTTDSVFPGEPAPTVPAARSATPVARLASLAEPVHSDLVAQFVPPRPHRSARRPPGGMDLSPPEAAFAS